MKNIFLPVSLLILLYTSVGAQETTYHSFVKASGGYITNDRIPFWLRSNRFGSIPSDGASLGFIGAFGKEYDTENKKLFDWGASFEGRANIGDRTNLTLIEGYGKIKVSIFEIRAGRSKEILGLCDSTLSTGAFAVSGNSLGIPKVEISIPEFYTIPFLGHLFAFKGNFAHGWFGDLPVQKMDSSEDTLKTFLHQLSFYGQFGKPEWNLKLLGGFNHQAQWGSEAEYFGDVYTLSGFTRYWYVIRGKAYGTNQIPKSKIGNHLGSIDLGLKYQFPDLRLFAYHQFFYDIGALYHLANLRDGLSGVSLTNTRPANDNMFFWKKIVAEFFFTKNQAGEFWSPLTPSGDENYYNNDNYPNGWSYKGLGIGNPLIGTRKWIRDGLPSDPGDYFINNRVAAIHLGFEGQIQETSLVVKTTYSLNQGTFGTNREGHSLGSRHDAPFGIFPQKKQFSAYVEANRPLKNQLNVGVETAFDIGQLYYNSFGILLNISKSF